MLGMSRRLSIRLQLMGLFALVLAAGLAVLALDEAERRDNARVVDQLREESIQSLRLAKAMSDAYVVDILGATFRVRNELISWEEGLRIVDDARQRIDRSWVQLSADPRTQRQREMLSRLRQVRGPADSAARKLRDIMARQDDRALGMFADTELFPAMDPMAKRLKALSDLQLIEADRRVREAAERAREASLTRLALTGAGLLLMAVLASSMVRNIYRGVESLRDLSAQMRGRDYDTPPQFIPSGELGQVMAGFLEMRDAVRRFEGELHDQLQRTEEVRASLQQSEVFQRSLLAAAQVAVISIDTGGSITSFNPFAEKLTGFRGEELSGPRGLEKIMLAEELERVADMLSLALEREVAGDVRVLLLMVEMNMPPREWTLVRRDGSHAHVLLALSVMRDESGAAIGYLGVATDLTQIKQLEQRLRASEMAAREASVAKSTFLAVMSHEIRTPMIGITGMLEVLSHSSLDGEQRRTFQVIQQSAAALLRIVGDILDFSKVEAGRIELSPHTISLQDLLQSVLASFAGSASSKGLVLRLQLDPRAAPAHVADGLRLRQVLGNFVSNAVKFTEHGSIELALERRGGDTERESLRFRVTDTGIGVTPEQQARLFQPFSQAEGSTTRRYGGTGLGLVISQRLAELMGGQLSMSSEPSAGTTMILDVSLPIGRVEDVEPASAGMAALRFEPRPLPTIAEAVADRSLVLVVDDHATNRLVIGRQLALAGYASESAEDGEAGLRAMHSGRYALVLSDVHMPVMDGYEMTRQWRAAEVGSGRKRLPVVALTAAALAGEAERCLEAGMDDYLAKPVSIPALAACLRKWLPHTAQALVAGPAPAPTAAALGLPLQPETIEELSQGDRRMASGLVRDFLTSTDADLAELRRALQAGDDAAQARQAHRIGGSSRLIGAMELAEASRALELAARTSDSARLLPACAEVEAAAERLRLYLESEYPG